MQVSAPGKLILVGEYAVLDGSPGLVMAMNRRARVTLERSADRRWHIIALQDERRETRFTLDQKGLPHWDRPEDAHLFVLVDTILRGLSDLGLGQLSPFTARLDTREFFDDRRGGQKLGIGSSAALTVCLVDALQNWAHTPLLDQTTQLARLLALHRRFQAGRGSGIDLAASLVGGILEYRCQPTEPTAQVLPGKLPPGLHFSVVWSGKSASTGRLLEQFEAATRSRPRDWRPIRDNLGASASRASDAFRGDLAEPLLEAIAAFTVELRHLQEFSGIEIFTAEHQYLAQLAADRGLGYKPSGAGGGDLGLVLGTDPQALAQFCREAEKLGFYCPDLSVEKMGLERCG